jgi:predicted transcriptional regulator with HTH domain
MGLPGEPAFRFSSSPSVVRGALQGVKTRFTTEKSPLLSMMKKLSDDLSAQTSKPAAI